MKITNLAVKMICTGLFVSVSITSGCVSSSVSLGEYGEKMVNEHRVKSEDALAVPIVEIVKSPSISDPNVQLKVQSEKVRRELFNQKYQGYEKIEQKTSGEGLLIAGAVSVGGGFFWWLIGSLVGMKDPNLSAKTNADNKKTGDQMAKTGEILLFGGLIPLIIGASTDKQTSIVERPTGTYDKNVQRDIDLGQKVPRPNLLVSASVNNNRITSTTSGSTDKDGLVSLKIDNILAETIATAAELPQSVDVKIASQEGSESNLHFTIGEAIAIMSGGKIDWSAGKEALTPYLQSQLKIGGVSKADETVILQINVSNKKGKGDCYQLQARIKSEEDIFNRRIVIGRVKAGEEITVEDRVKIPRLWLDRVLPLNITFSELYNNIPDPLEARLVIDGLPRPNLAYSYQIIDDGTGNSVGNGDGQAQKGEALDIEVTVNNTGSVPAKNTNAEVSFVAAPGEGISIQRNSLPIGDLQPNQSKKGRFTIAIKRIAQANEFKLNLNIKEENLNVSTTDVIDFKIGAATESKAIVMNPKRAYVSGDTITVHGGANADSIARFRLTKDITLMVIGQIGDWYKVDLGDERTGWVFKDDIAMTAPKEISTTTASVPTVIEVLQKAPPLIVLAYPQKNTIETVDDSIKVAGTAGDNRSIEKVDILVNGKLVKSLATRGINIVERPNAKPEEKVPMYPFEQVLPLEMGQNEIRVIAYNEEGLRCNQVINVTRIEQKGNMYLLSIGISTYDDCNIKSLPYAEEDARAVVDYYTNNALSPIKPENIITLYGKLATSRNIRKSIGEMARKAKEYDTVMLYYAGHGDVGKHPNKGTEYYLIPVDAEKDNLFSTAIELTEMQRLWSAITSKRKVFIADSCNSGGFTDLRGDVDGFEKGMGEGTIVMTASSRGQKAIEDPELKHGLFTYYLLEGLKGKADEDKDKRISISELKKYLDKEVSNKAKEMGSAQTPVIKMETSGEIYLTK
jgi:hypothetical protein